MTKRSVGIEKIVFFADSCIFIPYANVEMAKDILNPLLILEDADKDTGKTKGWTCSKLHYILAQGKLLECGWKVVPLNSNNHQRVW